MDAEDLLERARIREIVESWAVWRDGGDWARLRTLWHDDGRMVATWFTGTADEFIAGCARRFQEGALVHHFLGGCHVDLAGSRAVAQTKLMINSRTRVEGVTCDAICTGRFYDFLEKRAGRWGIVLRALIYEKDRLDPLEPGTAPALDSAFLDSLPAGYRHLAYAQIKEGRNVHRDLPQLRGPEVERLYADGAAWLDGRPLAR